MTGLFIEQGPTVQIRHSSKQIYRDGKRTSSSYYTGPLAVLINRLSASASEIFAGAIQDYQRGVIVGTQSFGKGTVQSLTALEQGQLKVTESKFYRISGESTQHRGVVPDVAFPAIYDKQKVGESSLDNALAWDTINPIRHRKYFDIPAVIPALIAKHEQRMETDPDFIFLKDQLQVMEENRKITSLSLNEETRRALQLSIEGKALAIENKRRIAKGLEPLDDLETDESESAADANTADTADTADTAASASDAEDEDKEIGPLLTETGHILLDSLTVYQVDKVAATTKR